MAQPFPSPLSGVNQALSQTGNYIQQGLLMKQQRMEEERAKLKQKLEKWSMMNEISKSDIYSDTDRLTAFQNMIQFWNEDNKDNPNRQLPIPQEWTSETKKLAKSVDKVFTGVMNKEISIPDGERILWGHLIEGKKELQPKIEKLLDAIGKEKEARGIYQTGATVFPPEPATRTNLLSGSEIQFPSRTQEAQAGLLRQNIPNVGIMEEMIKAKVKPKEFTPSDLAKLQTEYNVIKNANPNDPRLAQYEAEFKRRAEGLPYYTFQQTSEGITPANVRSGELGQPSGAGKPFTGEMITTEQQIGTLKETLQRVKTLYKDNYVGAVTGRLAGLAEKTVGLSSEQAQFNSDLAQVKNSLIYLMSGKQINESEYKRLLDQLPDKNLPPSVFKARMSNFDKTLNSIISQRQKNIGGYGKQRISQPKPKFEIIGVE